MKAARGAAAREPLGGEANSPEVEEQRLRHPHRLQPALENLLDKLEDVQTETASIEFFWTDQELNVSDARPL